MSENQKPFIPAWLDEAGLTQAEFRLYCHLCRRADNQTGVAWPSYQAIQDSCGLSRKTVWRNLKDLEAHGLIAKVGKPFGGSSRYKILSSIVSSGERLIDSNSVTGGMNDDSQSFPSGNSNRSPHDAPIVSPGEREGNPMKEIQLRKSKREVSPEGIEFAIWFKSTLPKKINLTSNWQQSFAESHDELVRLDKRSPEEIRTVSQWARSDGFWQTNFMSPAKLRKRNGDGITYFDVFAEKMKQPTGQTSNGKPVNTGRRGGTYEVVQKFAGIQENIPL